MCGLLVEEDDMTHFETLRRGRLARGLIAAAAASTVTVLLSGCMTTDAYTGDKKVSKPTLKGEKN